MALDLRYDSYFNCDKRRRSVKSRVRFVDFPSEISPNGHYGAELRLFR